MKRLKKKQVDKKTKISQLAKDTGKTSKELVEMLKGLGVSVKTAASSVDDETVKIIKELLDKKVEKPEKKTIVVSKAPDSQPVFAPKQAEPKVIIEEPKPKPEVVEIKLAGLKVPEPVAKKIIIKIKSDGIILKDLADKLGVKASDVIKELMKKGTLATLNQKISSELAQDIGQLFASDIEIEIPPKSAEKDLSLEIFEDSKNLKTRPPVVTIMGHVDHGKTKLLDAIRSTKVAESEAGGITQHIGAYQIEIKGKKITFLDTPGHEAFTALRARGAKATDIAILVVAADDGVMPQTIEAIDHAKAAGVPIIVAINKIDKPEANPDKVKQQLSELGLQPEDWGGKTVTVPVSARQKLGIDELLEMILLVSEMEELKANPDAKAVGIVIESRLVTGRGPVATVLIKNGTLHIGDCFFIGPTYGKVRALISYKGERRTKAGPSTPIEVLGISSMPVPGDILYVKDSEKEAKDAAEKVFELRKSNIPKHKQTLEEFSKTIESGTKSDLNLVLKADVQGSLEALISSLKEIAVENDRVNIIHGAVGNISESDVLLAEASSAVLIGFNVDIDPRAREIAEKEDISIKTYSIIYKLLDDVKLAMEGSLTPEYEEVVIGTAEVRQTFKFSKIGVIAGSFVKSGKLLRGAGLRIMRDGEKVYEGKLESLKRFKEDVKEALEGYECGVAIVGYEDFKPGDILECFETREKSRK